MKYIYYAVRLFQLTYPLFIRATVFHLSDLVFSDHHHSERAHGRQRSLERVDEVVIDIQKDQVRQVGQVADLGDIVVLVVQQPQSILSLVGDGVT